MADLGQKHECSECGAKFYDLGKADTVCPRCGTPVTEGDEEPKVAKSRRKRRAPTPAKARVADDEVAGGGADEDLDEDDEDIEELDTEDLDDEEIEGLDEDDEEEDEDDKEEAEA